MVLAPVPVVMRKLLIILAICFTFVTACGSTSSTMGDGGGPGNGNRDGSGMGLPQYGDGGVCSAAPDASMESPPDATLAIDEACSMHDQCITGLCFPFNSKGPHCSAPCTEGCQCPGTTGCSNMGVCKSP
jgi:hypothetical protein